MTEQAEIRVEIYDPPMCCPGGLCGPDIDEELLDISEAVLRVSSEFGNQVRIERYVLSQQPMKFAQNQALKSLLQSEGVDALPVTCLNGGVWLKRRYPTYVEMQEAIATRLSNGTETKEKSR